MKVAFIVELPGGMARPRQYVTDCTGTHTVSSAFRRGVLDGLEQPDELSRWMTYDDKKLSEAYDEGVNLGQAVGRMYGGVEPYVPDRPGGEE